MCEHFTQRFMTGKCAKRYTKLWTDITNFERYSKSVK